MKRRRAHHFAGRVLSRSGRIVLGPRPKIIEGSSLNPYIIYEGRHTYGLEHLIVHRWDDSTYLRVGSFCSIADAVRVLLGGNHRLDWMTTYPFGHVRKDVFPLGSVHGRTGHPASRGDVVVGNDCWIGHGALLLSGSPLSDGAVLGARSVLAGPTEPYGVYVGNPAKLSRKRFPDTVIEELLEIRWWEWPDDLINEAVPLLKSEPTPILLEKLEQIARANQSGSAND